MNTTPPGAPPTRKAPPPLEGAIERVLDEARIAKMSERDPHYRYLLTILALSHQTQQLASKVIERVEELRRMQEELRQMQEKMRHDLNELGKHRPVQAPPVEASPPEAKQDDDTTGLAWVAGIVLCLLVVSYALGDRGVLGSSYTSGDRLKQAFSLDSLSVRILGDLIPLNDLHQIAATCKAKAYYVYGDDRRACNVTIVVPPPSQG
jgi:hypothetical protein